MIEFERPLFSLFQIGISIQALNKRSEKSLGLSLVQWCVLRCLMDRPASSAYLLAQAVGVHPSTLTQTLKRLERKKFIFIMDDPRDSRKKLISLTKLGNQTLGSAAVHLETWAKDLSVLEQELFRVRTYLESQKWKK